MTGVKSTVAGEGIPAEEEAASTPSAAADKPRSSTMKSCGKTLIKSQTTVRRPMHDNMFFSVYIIVST
jgi:hypothetical protein